MSYDPNEPRDKDGKWATGGANRSNVGQIEGSIKRFGRMNSTSKAQLTSKATFKSTLVGPTKKSKGKVTGSAPASVKSDERVMSYYGSNTVEKRKGKGSFQDTGRVVGPRPLRDQPKELNFFANAPSAAAVAIQTAKALDRDFHAARDKANQEAMKAALAKSKVPVVKYPSKKPKR